MKTTKEKRLWIEPCCLVVMVVGFSTTKNFTIEEQGCKNGNNKVMKKKKFCKYLRVRVLLLKASEVEISVMGMWKASDHDNCLSEVAVGVPQR